MGVRKVDALQLLQSVDDKSVDLILTDPPYCKLLNTGWDQQWKTKEDFSNWLEDIVKECRRALKDNWGFYIFASADMSWYVESVSRKHVNVLNHIRWVDKQSFAKRCNKEHLRQQINNSEEIIFAPQFVASDAYNHSREGLRSVLFEQITSYLYNARIQANLRKQETHIICNAKNTASRHYFDKSQWCLPVE